MAGVAFLLLVMMGFEGSQCRQQQWKHRDMNTHTPCSGWCLLRRKLVDSLRWSLAEERASGHQDSCRSGGMMR